MRHWSLEQSGDWLGRKSAVTQRDRRGFKPQSHLSHSYAHILPIIAENSTFEFQSRANRATRAKLAILAIEFRIRETLKLFVTNFFLLTVVLELAANGKVLSWCMLYVKCISHKLGALNIFFFNLCAVLYPCADRFC